MFIRLTRCWLFAMALAVALGMAEGVAAQHFDVFLSRPATGARTVIGGADVDSSAYDDVTRAFEVELGAVAGEFLALEPGVNHPNLNNPVTAYPSSAAGLQAGDVLSLEEREFSVGGAMDDLFFWNGAGTVAFTAAAADFRIDGGDPLGSAAGLGGAFDDHPFLVIDSDALPGIYLASARGTVAGFGPSAPIYFVMGAEGLITAQFLGISEAEFDSLSEDDLDAALEEVIEMAVRHVEANLVVPEPASLALAAMACCAIAAMPGRRRKEQIR
jgi:hypothetical protein